MMFFRVLFNFFQAEEILKNRDITPEELQDTVRQYVDVFLNGILVEKQ
jgi:hypothetical protein